LPDLSLANIFGSQFGQADMQGEELSVVLLERRDAMRFAIGGDGTAATACPTTIAVASMRRHIEQIRCMAAQACVEGCDFAGHDSPLAFLGFSEPGPERVGSVGALKAAW